MRTVYGISNKISTLSIIINCSRRKKNCVVKSFMTGTPHQILFTWENSSRTRCAGHIVFCWGNPKEREHLEDLGIIDNIKMNFRHLTKKNAVGDS